MLPYLEKLYQSQDKLSQDLVVALIIAAVTAWIPAVLLKAVGFLRARRGRIYGTWIGVIFDDKGINIVKNDVYFVYNAGGNVFVYGRRLVPVSENHYKWTFRGKITGNVVVGYFSSDNKTVSSSGCALLKANKDHDILQGFYLKNSMRRDQGGSTLEKPRRVKYEWRKINETVPFWPSRRGRKFYQRYLSHIP